MLPTSVTRRRPRYIQRITLDRYTQTESGRKTGDVEGLNNDHLVDAMERCGNRQHQVERLVSAWSKDSGKDVAPPDEPDDSLIEASPQPRRRPRTRLTNEEVNAMRTARAHGLSVTTIARQFGVHRGTVWAKTR